MTNVDALRAGRRSDRAQPARHPGSPARRGELPDVVGVVLLDADHYTETLDWDDPTGWVPPAGLGTGFLSHPDYWSRPAIFAVARGATAEAAAERRPEAIRGVVDAVRRLDGRCRVIVGTCGHFCDAWAELDPAPETPTILSALDVLPEALRWSRRDVLMLTMTTEVGRRSITHTPGSTRVRVVGIDGAGDWWKMDRPTWVTHRDWSEDGLEAGLRQVLESQRGPGGALEGVGGVLLVCTILPQFTSVIREYTDAPIVHVGGLAQSLLWAT